MAYLENQNLLFTREVSEALTRLESSFGPELKTGELQLVHPFISELAGFGEVTVLITRAAVRTLFDVPYERLLSDLAHICDQIEWRDALGSFKTELVDVPEDTAWHAGENNPLIAVLHLHSRGLGFLLRLPGEEDHWRKAFGEGRSEDY